MCENDEATARIEEILKLNQNNVNDICVQTAINEQLKLLRNLCARGAEYQITIAEHEQFHKYLHALLFDGQIETQEQKNMQSTAWQLLANTVVQNTSAQCQIWQKHGERIVKECTRLPLGRHTEIKLMILYNIYQSELNLLPPLLAMQSLVAVWQTIVDTKCNENFEFLHFFFERFLVHDGRTCVRCYAQMSSTQRLTLLNYLVTYLRHDSPNGMVNAFLLQHLSKEFKMKSDCILRTVKLSNNADYTQPREVYALLRVIASSSGCNNYAVNFVNDHALFLNVSSLLRALIALGKEASPNMFTPKSKLEEVSPSSRIPHDFEQELSFELKTLLVRCVANLLYKNKVNQGYCLDTQLLPALLESTIIDARNPCNYINSLISSIIFNSFSFLVLKEWSILAIRNACDGCDEVQNVIANLTKQGDAPNDILKELNLQMGSLRIQPNTD